MDAMACAGGAVRGFSGRGVAAGQDEGAVWGRDDLEGCGAPEP